AAGARSSAFALPAAVESAPPPAATAAVEPQGEKFSRFSHNNPREHGAFMTDPSKCDSCHRRTQSAEPLFPPHKACTDCHLAQFVQQNIPMCAICHDRGRLSGGGLSAQNPGLTRFPRLQSFNMEFNHEVHNAGSARPRAGCSTCHAPINRRVALSIPDGFAAHNNCYDCHKPGSRAASGQDIGSCSTCHQQKGYLPSRTTARAYRAGFSHGDHGTRQGLSCNSCHNVNGIRTQAQRVPSPRTAFHTASTRAQSCMTCHNDKRVIGGRVVFGDTNFDNCRRCHTGSNFRVGL
ncbi:MAG: cytochrome c3 family protein, partial [Pyrinomonadaceae bacterium]